MTSNASYQKLADAVTKAVRQACKDKLPWDDIEIVLTTVMLIEREKNK